MSRARLKWVFDAFIVILAAPLWVPLMLLVAILVRWRLGSPVFFRQRRPGLGGRIFELIKFRSMIDAWDANGRPLPDAERLPAFGRRLRGTSLDELPELLNVLKGEMSLVGPRPLLVQYLSRYSAEQARRHELPPGLTGWAQVNGRNSVSWDERLAMDVWYVDHWSIWLDVRILAKTVFTVVRREGISAAGDATMPEFRGSTAAGDGGTRG